MLFLLTRRRPVSAVWPALALVLTPVYLTLVAPAGAAVLGRYRGPLTAAWAGAATLFYLLLVRVPRGPFTGFQPRVRLDKILADAEHPLAVVWETLDVALAWPCLAQMLLWAATGRRGRRGAARARGRDPPLDLGSRLRRRVRGVPRRAHRRVGVPGRLCPSSSRVSPSRRPW